MKTSSTKIEANRRNAQRSTGPRSAEGRAASSRNAIRTGLTTMTPVVMPGESPEDLDDLSESIRNDWNPSGDHENFLVDQMISARWCLERLARWEAEAIHKIVEGPEYFFDRKQARAFEAKSADRLVVEALQQKNTIFDRLERYTRAAERAYSKAVKELQQHRAAAAKTVKQNEATAKRKKAKEDEEWLRAGLAEVARNGIPDPMAGLWNVEQNEPNFDSDDRVPDSALSA
jgi:hypothetical protein